MSAPSREQKSALREAQRAHTNLTVFASLVSILEGGNIYGGMGSDKTAQKIIRLCKAEQARLLRVMDIAEEHLFSEPAHDH